MWKHLRKKKEQSQVYEVSPDWFFQRATRKYEDTIRKLFIYIYVYQNLRAANVPIPHAGARYRRVLCLFARASKGSAPCKSFHEMK